MIIFKQAQVAAGSAVAGSIAWRPGIHGRAGDIVVCWLIWRTALADGGEIGPARSAIEDYTVVEKQRLDPGPGGMSFEFRIPEQGPLSHEGKLLRVVWEIVAGTESTATGLQVALCGAFKVVPRSRTDTSA